MHLRHLLLLGSLALVSACKEERLLLRFDEPVDALLGIDADYKQAILRGLDEAGVDSGQASLSVREGGRVVAVSLPDSALDRERQLSLTHYFDQLVSDRTHAGTVRLRIHNEAPADAEDSPPSEIQQMLREKASKMRPLFTSAIGGIGEPQVSYRESGRQTFAFVPETSPVFCQLTISLKQPLPQIDHQLSLPGSPLSALLSLQSFRLPSTLSFGDIDLAEGVAAKRFSYELGSSGLSSRVDQLVFSFGGLGQVQHQGGKVSGESLEQLESACLTRIIDAGRPFSFHFGRSLDRLVAVEYRLADATVTR